MAEDPRPPSHSAHLPTDPEPAAQAWWTRPFATAGPDAGEPVRYGAPVGFGEPVRRDAVGPDARPRSDRRSVRQALATQGRRRAWTIMSVMGGAPLLAALALVALMPDPPPLPDATAAVPTRTAETAASRSSREATAVTPSATPTRPSGEPADLAAVTTEAATTDLRRAGITVEGTINSAWGWTDARGRSLVAAIKDVTAQADDGSPTGVGLWVYYITGLDSAEPDVRRKLKDPALRCNDKGVVTAGYTGSAFGVRDLDGNGTTEVMIGWTARCGEPTAASRVRLAVISGAKLYVLRGTGVVTGRAAHEGDGTEPGVTVVVRAPAPNDNAPTPTTVPSASQWPAAVLDAALATFHGSYY